MAVPSRLLDSLLTEARSTRDRVAWARAVCRAAAHYARSGRVEESLATMAKVREVFGPGLHPEVASWLMLSEGILHYCQYRDQAGTDRILRARALAVAFKTDAAVPTCAAWMAAIQFNLGQYEKVASNLDEAFRLSEPNDHQTRSRAALTYADAMHVCAGYEAARKWYEECRRHAVSEGDEATLGAMLCNVAMLRLNALRLADAFSERSEPEALRASLEATGSVSFDLMTGNSNQEQLRFVLQSLQLIVEGKFAELLEHFDRLDLEGINTGNMVLPSLADRAWSLLQVGRIDEAKALAAEILTKTPLLRDTDDVAYVYARLAQIEEATSAGPSVAKLWDRAKAALSEHRAFQADLYKLMSGVNANTTK